MKKILYGVCGLGNGHAYRQLPVLDYLAKHHRVMVFAYGDSLKFYAAHFKNRPNVRLVPVAVPYYVSSRTGIDFASSAKRAAAADISYVEVNCRALQKATDFLGKPDLVISDYEPVSAQYAYAHDAPLVTIDQPSSFLPGTLPAELNGYTYLDEVMRLRMFFPKAAARIACSFFAVPKWGKKDSVTVLPPALRPEVQAIKANAIRNSDEILVYLSPQTGLQQTTAELLSILSGHPAVRFHVFLPGDHVPQKGHASENIIIYKHGDKRFLKLLQSCGGIITTAGHTLLSEAMHVGTPVLAMPLPLYEQQMNALVISTNKFGMSTEKLTPKVLDSFIKQLDLFTKSIQGDTQILLRGDGGARIINFLEQHYL